MPTNAPPGRTVDAPGSQLPTVLIIDDEPMIRSILQRALKITCVVDTASNPVDAISMLGTRTYDLVITDINMPGGSGFMVAEYLRKHCQGTQLAFLAAVIDEESAHRIDDLKAAVFHKPFDIVDLVATIGHLLKKQEP